MNNKPTGYRVEYLCGGCNKAHAWGECTKEKQLKKEPVAWYYENINGISWVSGTREQHDENFVIVEKPLFTHLAKTLTNEEIYEVWKKAMQEEAKIEYSIYATQLERQPFLYFARAILRKAQEK